MITLYRTTETGLEKIPELTNGCWIMVVDPTTEEIERVNTWGIPLDYITYPLDIDERPRTEKEDDGTTLIIFRIPYYQGSTVDIPYTTIPLGVVITDRYVLTVCRRHTDVLQEFANGRLRGFSTAKRNRFLLQLLLFTASKFLSYLREINKNVDIVEDKLQVSMRNKEVLELLKYQKSLVYFTTALKSNELMLERLQRSKIFRLYPEDEDVLEDVITENQQAIEMTNISSNILSGMMDAFASIISNNLNVVMKFLASMTIVVSLPSIVAAFFGMNVNLPFNFETQPLAFLIILGISLAVSIIVVIIFMRRNWF